MKTSCVITTWKINQPMHSVHGTSMSVRIFADSVIQTMHSSAYSSSVKFDCKYFENDIQVQE